MSNSTIKRYNGSSWETLEPITTGQNVYGSGTQATTPLLDSSNKINGAFLPLGSTSSTAAAGNHLYHYWTSNQYYSDSYSGGKNWRMMTENVLADTLRFKAGTIDNKEYYNYDNSTWTAWNKDFSNLFDGMYGTNTAIPYAQRKFRFTITSSSGWPTDTMVCLEGSWYDAGTVNKITGTNYYVIVTIETRSTTNDSWTTKVTANFSNNCMNKQALCVPSSALHTGHTLYRITVELAPWTNTTKDAALRRLMILSNYGGNALTPLTFNGSGKVTAMNTLNATTLQEGGTNLSSKYLGISATAADSSKLDGKNASYYLDYENFTNTPTIPTTYVSTVNGSSGAITNVAKTNADNSFSTAQTFKDITLYSASGDSPRLTFQRGTLTDTYNDWSFYDSGGYLYIQERGSGSSAWGTRATFTQSGVNFAGTISENGTELSSKYYAATNPNGYTSNAGTITGVSVNGTSVATSGVAALTNIAKTDSANTFTSAQTMNSGVKFAYTSGGSTITLTPANPDANYTLTLPARTDTIATLTDIPSMTNVAYKNSANTFTTAQTINSSSGNTCLTLKSAGSSAGYITYRNSSNTYLGAIGVLKSSTTGNVARPVFDNGSVHQIAYLSDISGGTQLYKHTLTDESTGNVWVIVTTDDTAIEYDSSKLYWRFYGTYISAMVCWNDGDGYRWYNAEIQATDSYAPYGSVPSEITYFSSLKILGRNTLVSIDEENFGEIITEL